MAGGRIVTGLRQDDAPHTHRRAKLLASVCCSGVPHDLDGGLPSLFGIRIHHQRQPPWRANGAGSSEG
jgi:hypothetical protein